MKSKKKTKIQLTKGLRKKSEKVIRYQKALLELERLNYVDSDSAMKNITEMDSKALGVERVSVWLFNKERTAIVCEDLYELSKNSHEKGLRLKAKRYPRYFQALGESRSVAADDARIDSRTNEFAKGYLEPYGITSMLDVPIRLHGKVVGIVCHEHIGPKRKWKLEEQNFAASIADFISLALEASQRRKAEKDLKESEKRFQQVVENAQEWIWEIDESGLFTYSSPGVKEILGYKPEEIVGKKHFYDLFHPKDQQRLKTAALKIIAKKEAFRKFINRNLNKNGKVVWILTSGVPIIDKKGRLLGYRGADSDITERKEAELEREKLNKELLKSNRKLKKSILIDPLTDLYNHHYFEDVIKREFYRVKRYAHPLSMIMLDIDYFKSINDVYGHRFGDLVLKQFADLIKKMIRQCDIALRFGGEEFIIICPGIDKSKALILARRLLNATRLYNFGNKRKKIAIRLKLSAAIASFPEDRIFKGMDFIEVADKILNKVKEDGGDRVYSSLDLKRKTSHAPEEEEDVEVLKEKIDKLTKGAHQSLIEAVFAFAKTIKLKDHYTGEHVESTVYFATEISRLLGLPKEETELIKQAAVLHDLGKIGISDKILLKKSKLTKKEFDVIKKHPQIAVDIIRPIQFLHGIIPLILYHHEKWDGKGYPSGLKEKEIPIGARIIAIADVYQALISKRPYHKAYSRNNALKIIKEESGTRFDPKVVEAFLKVKSLKE